MSLVKIIKRRTKTPPNKKVYITKCKICGYKFTYMENDIFEINHGDTELLLKHLKAITNIMNKAIKELERKEVSE